jgi:hypothetical protein
LGEVDRHTIKDLSRLRVQVHALVTLCGNSHSTFKKLSEKQDKEHEYADGDHEFSQGECT